MLVKGCVTENIEEGINFLIHAGGLGGLEPNTVMIKWPNCFLNQKLIILLFFFLEWIAEESRKEKFI